MLQHASNIQAGYDHWSSIYDHDGNPLLVLEEPLLRELAGEVAGLQVLDAGCGTGRHSLWLANQGARVTAMDFSVGMVEQAKQKPGAEAIEFTLHDLHCAFPFHANQFDLVVSGLVLEHLAELGPFFREVYRVLKPGGRIVVSTLHPAMFLRGSQARFTDPVSGQVVQPGSYPHTMSQLVLSGIQAGFQLLAMEERSGDQVLAQRYPRAEKYIGWPMLVVLNWKRCN